jgi:hypothetical protein
MTSASESHRMALQPWSGLPHTAFATPSRLRHGRSPSLGDSATRQGSLPSRGGYEAVSRRRYSDGPTLPPDMGRTRPPGRRRRVGLERMSALQHGASKLLCILLAIGVVIVGAPTAAIAGGTNTSASEAVVRADIEEHPHTAPYALRNVHCRRMEAGAFECNFPAQGNKLGGDVRVIYRRGAYTVGQPTYESTEESQSSSITPTFYLALISAVVGLGTVGIALLQLRRILRTVRIGREANSLQAVMHCSNRYNTLIKEIPSLPEDGIQNWQYTFWDLITIEFFFFRKTFLDRDIFELWMVELVAGYDRSLDPRLPRGIDSHRQYLDSRPWQLGSDAYTEMYVFFRRLMRIFEEDREPRPRASAIKALFDDFSDRRTLKRLMHNEEATIRGEEIEKDLDAMA